MQTAIFRTGEPLPKTKQANLVTLRYTKKEKNRLQLRIDTNEGRCRKHTSADLVFSSHEYAFIERVFVFFKKPEQWSPLADLNLIHPTSINHAGTAAVSFPSPPLRASIKLSGLVSSTRPLLLFNPPLPPKRRHIFCAPLPCSFLFFKEVSCVSSPNTLRCPD